MLDDSSVLGLGNIAVERKPKKLPEGVNYFKMLSKCQAQKIRTININVHTTNVAFANSQGAMPRKSIVLMSEDHFIVSDYAQDVLRLFSGDGKNLNELRVGANTRGMCRVDRDTVAVALASGRGGVFHNHLYGGYASYKLTGIHIVRIHDSKLTSVSTISMPHNLTCYYGITHIAGEYAVSTPRDIYRVTKQGEATYIQSLGCGCHNLAYDEHSDRIVATLAASYVAVVTLSNGSQNEVLKTGVVSDVTGVDVDRDGNIYVCGQASNNVVMIPADGTKVRELLTSVDGISRPLAISVYGDRFVVSCVSLQQQSEVHVYRMR